MTVKEERKRENKFPKKKLFAFVGRSLETTGWLGLMYFLWMNPEPVGIVFSLISIFAGMLIDVFIT